MAKRNPHGLDRFPESTDDPHYRAGPGESPRRTQAVARYRMYKQTFAAPYGQQCLQDLKDLVGYGRIGHPEITGNPTLDAATQARWHLIHSIVTMVERPMNELIGNLIRAKSPEPPPDDWLCQEPQEKESTL